MGIVISIERFPNLYRKAEKDPKGLAEQIRYFAEGKNDPDSIESSAIILEHDLQHERGLR